MSTNLEPLMKLKRCPSRKPRPGQVPLETLIRYRREKGLSWKNIGKIVGLAPTVVKNRVVNSGLVQKIDHIADIRAARADVLDATLSLVMDDIPNKIEAAPLNHLAITAGILYDKSRLEQGKSTENRSYAVSIREEREVNDREAEILRELKQIGDGSESIN